MFQKIAAFIVCLLSAVALLVVGGFLSKDNPLTQFQERATGRYLLLVQVIDQEIVAEELHISRLADGDYRQEKENLNEEIRQLKLRIAFHEFNLLFQKKSIESVQRYVKDFGLSPDQLRQLSSDPFYKDHIEVISGLYNKQFDSLLFLPSGAKDPLPKLW